MFKFGIRDRNKNTTATRLCFYDDTEDPKVLSQAEYHMSVWKQ